MSSETDDLLGHTLASQFRILKRLGAGGMGAVYLAEQADMGRRVVIKVMHPELTARSAQAAERFKREARAVAALNHPHIVQVYVFGQAEDGRMYLAMEYIDGRDLASEVKRGALPQGRALKILDQVAAALVEAHSHGIVHRDLKPENIMLADRHGNPDWVKVLDFGIAKLGADSSGKDAPALTRQGAIFGTPRYMAPEQATGGGVDARTDLYALGVILYEMLTGEHPFHATSAVEFLAAHVQEDVEPPSVRRPDLEVHPRVERLLERLLAKAPADRFQSAAELQREVRATLGAIGDSPAHTLSVSRDDTAFAAGRAAPGADAPARGRAFLWIALALLLAGGGVAAVLVATRQRPVGAEPPPATSMAQVPSADVLERVATADVLAPADAPASRDAAATDAPVSRVRAGTPIEGFPVPEGTTLVSSEPLRLILESTQSARDLLEFYRAELAGRAEPIANGFEVTDPTSPWVSVYFYSNGADRVAIQVGRRADTGAPR